MKKLLFILLIWNVVFAQTGKRIVIKVAGAGVGSSGTTVNGIVKGNGTSFLQAASGTDYAPGTAANATGIVKSTTATGALTTAVAADFPTLNQSTTGSAATLTTPRSIYGNTFDGSSALTNAILGTYGGTGVNNGTNTLTFAGNINHAGAFSQTFTATGNTSVTLPTAGTLSTLAGAEAFSNKDFTAGTNTFPTFNQNTTGSAATLTTSRSIYGNSFNGSSAISGPITGTYGGSGVNNGSNTLTLAGNVSHAGAFNQTFTATGNTTLTLPITGTLATLAGTETITNHDLSSTTNTFPGATTLATEYTVSTDPTTPLNGSTIYTKVIEGQRLPSIITPLESYILQPHFGFQDISMLEAGWGTTTISVLGSNTASLSTGVSSGAESMTSTSFRTQTKRTKITSAATAGSTAGIRGNVANFWRGNATGYGGFAIHMKFALSAVTSDRTFFCGVLNDLTAQAGNVATSSILNMLGIGLDGTDATFQFMRNDGTGTATKVNTGITPDLTTAYAVRIFTPANGAGYYITFADLQPGGATYETYVTTDIPANTTTLTWQMFLGNNATASAVALNFAKVIFATP